MQAAPVSTTYVLTASEKAYSSQKIVTGLHFHIMHYYLWLTITWIALMKLKNPFNAINAVKTIYRIAKDYMGNYRVQKFVTVGRRYFWDMVSPGFPSKAFNNHIENEINRIYPFRNSNGDLKIVMLAITKKCSLQCEHCFEWGELNQKERLTLENLKDIVKKFQRTGVAQFELGGGDPMNRFEDLIQLLKASNTEESDFWISTSGYGLTREKAFLLKHSGLTGVSVSLDHFDREFHNRFRGNAKAFSWAIEAAKNTQEAGLVVSFSLCATKEFISEENLRKYIAFAKEQGVQFIQIIEPRSVGHYANKDVELSAEHNSILERIMIEANYGHHNRHLPLITYHGYYQRRIGCFGAGNRYLYVDTDGDMHACPFCGNKSGNALDCNYTDGIKKMEQIGCGKFESVELN